MTEVKVFLWHVGYYQGLFLDNHCVVIDKITKITYTPPLWTNARTKAFNTLKKKLIIAPILIAPNWEKDFEVYIDASNVAIGAILIQNDENGHDHRIYSADCQLIQVEHKYTVTKREALGMIFVVQKFHHYLLGYKLNFHMDHDALKYMIDNLNWVDKMHIGCYCCKYLI